MTVCNAAISEELFEVDKKDIKNDDSREMCAMLSQIAGWKSCGKERTITNVAAGRITADSTDAINGSQLYAVSENLGDLGDQVASMKPTMITANEGDTPVANSDKYVGGNIMLKEDTDTDGNPTFDIKLNNDIDLTSKGSLTIGNTEILSGEINITDKAGNSLFASANNVVLSNKKGDVETIIGREGVSVIKGKQTVTIYADTVDMGGNVINNVAAGVEDTDAVNVAQLKEALGQHNGAAWQPSKNVMVNGGFADAAGEMMVNVGVFYKFGQKSYTVEELQAMNTGNGIPLYVAELNSVLESKDARISALESQVNELKAVVEKLVKNAK